MMIQESMKRVEAKMRSKRTKQGAFHARRLPEYIWERPGGSPSEASQREAPIGQNKASRGRMDVTAMASLHEESYSQRRGEASRGGR